MKAKSHIAWLTASCLLVSMLFGGAASADSVTVTADRLNIRKDADAASKIVDTVGEGEELSFVSESGDWYQVKNGDDTGFVLKEYVELDEEKMEEDVLKNTETYSESKTGKAVFRVNMRALPTTEARVVAIVSENASVKIKGRCGVWYVVEYDGKTGYIMAQYVTPDGETVAPSAPESDDSVYDSSKTGVAKTDVKLRRAATTDSAIADIIEDGDVVTILGESGEFYKVSFGGQEGYAAKAYITVSSSASAGNSTSGSATAGNLVVYDAAKSGVTTDRVNMRREPSTGAGIVMVVDDKEAITVTGEADGWYKVAVDGREGYIYKEWVAVNTTIYDKAKSGVTTEEVNFRAGASTASAVLKVLKGNTPVSITANEDGWYKVTVDGLTGYIMDQYVRISDTVTDEGDVVPDGLITYSAARSGKTTESVKLRGAASTDSDVVSILQGGASLSLLGEQGGFYQAKCGSLFGYVSKDYVTLVTTGADTPAEEDKDEDDGISADETIYSSSKNGVTTVMVNMRRAPEGDVLFTLPSDTKVTLLGEVGSWYKVSYSSSTGYIAKDYVSEELVVPSQPETDDDSDPTVEGEGTTAYITGSSVNMRRGAGTDSGIIKVLKYGAEIKFYSLNDGWYLIKAGDDTGYISSKYVSTEKPAAQPEVEEETETSTPDPGSGKVQMADWFKSDISDKFAIGDIVTVTDVETGLSWRVKRSGGYNHADVQPLTADDTAKMKQAYGGSWSWNRRAIWVTVDGVRYAASMNGMPHGTGSITTNNFDGHHCIHFLNSRTHTGNRWDTAHQNMVQKAFKAGQ